ncbi:hypothetical protein KTJ87_02910 [Rhodobacteraceae bacterium ASV31]|nr:hypothetical protein [Anianabacter salinae]
MGHGHGALHGADGTGHDEAVMPGLRGRDATPEESAEMAALFRRFEDLRRAVELLPNGIRTVTGTDDPDLMAILASHVTGMIGRVEDGRDPQVFIQSQTLGIFFERPEAIVTEITLTDVGIAVVQTSQDPEVVAALHAHAAEVTDMVDRGMEAVHDRMASQSGN